MITPSILARTIQFIVAPVVMVTTCGIVVNGVLARYSEVNARMRTMAGERLQLLCNEGPSPSPRYGPERIREIDHQLPVLLRRHRELRNSLQALYLAMLVFVLSMVAIGAVSWENGTVTASVALVLFLAGQMILLYGLYHNFREVRISHQAVEYEVQRIMGLTVE